MPTLYKNFDFTLLEDREFAEDSVREELVVPLLHALGYSASGPHRIVRSRKLEHPFVQIGTARKGITIIPDYLLERDGSPAWILDAKSPWERINAGKHVEQAYSYAIHRDIRVPLYALCNGRKLTVFHVSFAEPVFDLALDEIDAHWPELLTVLGCRSAWPEGRRPDFGIDLGLALLKAGFAFDQKGGKVGQLFLTAHIMSMAKIEDDLYSLSSPMGSVTMLDDDDNRRYMLTFDFGASLYQELLGKLDAETREAIEGGLSRQPYKVGFRSPEVSPIIGIAAEIGDHIHTNENESYCPFKVLKFL